MTGNFPQLLHAFFYDWLAGQRNNSPHTVRSYRDTWRLFLRFVAARHNRLVAALRLADFTAAEVLAFLEHSEKEFTLQEIVATSKQQAAKSFSGSHVNQMLVALQNTGLVYKNRHGRYSFAVPLLAQFIRRQMEIDRQTLGN